MEYLILGLLLLMPMTGYELQRFIKQNLSMICSSSAGSMQTALTKLENKGYITAAESIEGRRRKKTFSITSEGKAAFEAWAAQPMQADKVKNMELAHMFFLGLAKPAQRIEAIRGYIHQMQQAQETLYSLREIFCQAQQNPLPEGQNWEDVFRFQAYTIEYGIAVAEFEQKWYSRLLGEMEAQV